MVKYRLTATLNGRTDEEYVYTDDDYPNLDEGLKATIGAVAIVMSRSSDDDDPRRDLWAKGQVVLWDEQGNVMHRMEAKA
jgi:hypothetical protein